MRFAKLIKYVNDNLQKETTFFNIFIISAVKLKMLNHDLPTYNLPKRCFNNANVVLLMFPAMTDSTEETDERRFASRASTERPLAKRPASVPVDAGDLPKTCFFGKL